MTKLSNIINIDLHIHSSESSYKEKKGYVDESNINNIEILLKNLNINNINMFAITDHNRFNYELYDYEELGRGEPEIIETGRMITTGEYGGIKGFRNVYNNLEIEFKDEHEARNILELARYANVHTQKPLTTSELRFIYYYPDIAAKVMTVSPYYEPQGAIKERVDAQFLTKPHKII